MKTKSEVSGIRYQGKGLKFAGPKQPVASAEDIPTCILPPDSCLLSLVSVRNYMSGRIIRSFQDIYDNKATYGILRDFREISTY